MIEKILGQCGVDAVSQAKAKKGYGIATAKNEADEAAFSSFSIELARISGELRSVPEVRQDLIEGFKKKVEEGTYNPPLEKIAHNLLLAGILNIEE